MQNMRTIPTNLQAEQAVLGTVLANNDAHARIADLLKPEHFADPIHGMIYTSISECLGAGYVADPKGLAAAYDETGTLDEVGGTVYLRELLTRKVGIDEVGIHASQIVEAWKRRRAIDAAEVATDAELPPDYRGYAPVYLHDELARLEAAHRRLAEEARDHAQRLLWKAAVHTHQADQLKDLNAAQHPDPRDVCPIAEKALRDAAERFQRMPSRIFEENIPF
jgi:replicative DNA helicase